MASDPWQALSSLIDQIHAGRTMAALAVTGGGTGALAALLRRPGGSRTALEAHVPYSAPALAAYLGAAP
ncbi:MAG: hypothetical protein FJ029_12695, partial [Actinobacteria bacterium]|nr:hypothetical protein [Actinomycetota bacterium]